MVSVSNRSLPTMVGPMNTAYFLNEIADKLTNGSAD